MSKELELQDELSGFHPGSEGSAVVAYECGETVVLATKFAVDPEDDADGWVWGLGTTHLNVHGITELRDYLNGVLAKIGA
jgi:hypothetical protein